MNEEKTWVRNKAIGWTFLSMFAILFLCLIIVLAGSLLIFGSIELEFLVEYSFLSLILTIFVAIILIVPIFFKIKKIGEVLTPSSFYLNSNGLGIRAGKQFEDLLKWNEITGLEKKFFGQILFIPMNRRSNLATQDRVGSEFGDIIMIHNNNLIFEYWEMYKPAITPLRVKRKIPFFKMNFNQYNNQEFYYKNTLFSDRIVVFGAILMFNIILVVATFVLSSFPFQIIIVVIFIFAFFYLLKQILNIPRCMIIRNEGVEIRFWRKSESYFLGEYDFFYYEDAKLTFFLNHEKLQEIIFLNPEIEKDLEYIYRFYR